MKEQTLKLLIGALSISTAASLATAVYVVSSTKEEPPTIPDYLPIEHQQAVEIPSEEDLSDQIEVPEDGGGLTVICSPKATVHLKDRAIEFYYKNPSQSTVAVVLQLCIDDMIIAQSGAIYPGYKTYSLALEKSAKLAPGEFNGLLKIVLYDTETKTKKPIDSEVGIIVSVKD